MLLALLVATFTVGLASRALGWLPGAAVWVLVGAASSVCAVATSPRRPLAWFVSTACAAAVWGATLAPSRPGASREERPPAGGLARLTLEVERSGCGERGCWSEARLLRCVELEAHACAKAGVRLGVASGQELPLGAVLTALGTLRPRAVFRNPTPATVWPDVRPGLLAKLEDEAGAHVESISSRDRWLSRARTELRHALNRTLRAPHAGIARALLLGEGAAVDRELDDAIRDAGVSHVLAVSGMHVTLLVGALVTCLRLLWLRTPLALHFEARRAGATLGVVLAPLIARLCGGAPSAVRAAWTSTLLYLVVALGLRPCPLSVAALVVGVHAALEPEDALHPGFVLSVLATAALLTERRRAAGLLGALRESVRAWLATAPFLLLCFGQSSSIAVLANIALLPLGGLLVPLAAVHALIALTQLEAELPSGALLERASGAFVEAARVCASFDPGFALPPLSAWEVIGLALLALGFLVPLSRRARLGVAGAALGLIGPSELLLRAGLPREQLRVTFLDVGQGDATLLESGARTALIDAGGSVHGGPDPGAIAVLPLLRARRIARLDYVVLSHPHPDHYGGLRAVLDGVEVGELWDTGQAEADAEAGGGEVRELLARARARGVRVRRPDELCGATWPLGSARLRVLAPCPRFAEERGANDNSFVIRVAHGRRSVLLTGDVERAAEAELVQRGRALDSDVLKVAHHGSRTSSTAPLLAKVAPWLAIISAGYGNRFGHPHREVSERLARVADHVLRTDVSGGVELTSDGATLQVRAWDPAVALSAPFAPATSLTGAQEHQRHAEHRADEQDGTGETH